MDNTLSAAGLGENEERVYRASLQLGRATASDISSHIDIPRATVYLAMKNLTALELIDISTVEAVQHFLPRSPQGLITLAKEHTDRLDRSLPALFSYWHRQQSASQEIIGADAILMFLKRCINDGISRGAVFGDVSHETVSELFDDFFLYCSEKNVVLKMFIGPVQAEAAQHDEIVSTNTNLLANELRVLLGSYDIQIDTGDLLIAHVKHDAQLALLLAD